MSETNGAEMKRLLKRLEGAKNFHVDWEPGAASLTVEERAAELNRAFDEIDSGRSKPIDPDSLDGVLDVTLKD